MYISHCLDMSLSKTGSSYHHIVEAFKFAYAHRSQLGDPHHNAGVRNVNTKLKFLYA